MSDVKNTKKDEKAQVYRTVTEPEEGGTRDLNYRQFIYNKDTFDGGGLWVNARGLLSTEVMNSGLATEQDYVQFKFNRYNDIDKKCKVIYRYEIYDIESVDPIDFRATDIKVKARKSVDNAKYAGDRFYE